MKTVAIIAARMNSTRLPGKVLRTLGDCTVLGWVVEAAQTSCVDLVVVATTTEPADDAIVAECELNGWTYFRGSEQDVLERFHGAAEQYDADIIVRLTGDCPFLDSGVIDTVLLLRERQGLDYACNVDPPTWPDGLDVECFTKRALKLAHLCATRPSDRDCLTQYIQRNRYLFDCGNLPCPIPGLAKERWVLDTEDDMAFCQEVVRLRGCRVFPPSYLEILSILMKHPEVKKLNQRWQRNERFYTQRSAEPLPQGNRGINSLLLKRARHIQPYGASTYSKSFVAYGETAPLYLTHGDGGVCFDVDGNEYVDFVGGVGAVILGHRNPAVDQAIRCQLDLGIGFSLGTVLEMRVCERLAGLPGGGNMAVLGKNGSDATTTALRIARAATQRNSVIRLSGSYHGWHDWALGGTERGHGIPFQNGIVTAKHIDAILDVDVGVGDVAAVIVEPDRYDSFQLKKLQGACREAGTLLIFDEVFTGLRYPDLLVSREMHIHPDLTCVGKSIANGMPLSAVIGPPSIMRRFAPGPQPNAFYSTTHGGEALSLAACLATLNEISVGAKELAKTATCVAELFRAAADRHGMNIKTSGAPLNRITFETPRMANEFRCEMAHHGVLVYSSFNCMVAHSEADLTRLDSALHTTFRKIGSGTARSYQPPSSPIMRS